MEEPSDSCFEVVTTEKSGAEQPSASSQSQATREAKNGEPAEEVLLSDAAGSVQSGGGCEQLSSVEQSVWKEQEQSSLAQWERPTEGLGNQEVIRSNKQDVFDPDAPFSASSESTSVTNKNYSTLPEVTNSEGEEQPSQNSALSENMASGTVTGSMIEYNETLRRTKANFDKSIWSEKVCLDKEHFPGKAVQQNYHMPDVITVRVQSDSDAFQDVVVKIERPTYRKPFLGGFKNSVTGVEFHNAGSQTVPKKRPDRGIQLFCRETQTVFEKNKPQQTKNTTSTQMTKIGLYVSNTTDKLISPGKYLTAEEYHKCRLEAVIVLQTYFRRWHAINVVQNLREQKRIRLAWEAQEELRKKEEKEEKLRREHERRLNPKTKEDFELLYHALELWRQEETERINRTLTGAERKAALCGLLEQEAQLIASIGRQKLNANEENQQKAILHFLAKCAQPKRWKAYDGKITEMDTQNRLRARELLEIYRSISMDDIPKDERIDILLTLRRTVKEHECKLTQEIVELIDREIDLMFREVKKCNLEGLRKRICTLFLQYVKTPKFNPEVARMLKVPTDPLKLYKNVNFCHSCENYLPSTEFPVPADSCTIGRCHLCCKLYNETQRREAFLKYKLILENLRKSEADYQDNSKIVFLVQHRDLKYMIENIWGCQSALSACSDLYDLVMVRWDKRREWSPWNTILLTKDEADAHLKLCNLQEAYEVAFIHRIKQKHIWAENYFAQIPVMASFLHRSDNQANANDFLKTMPILTAGQFRPNLPGVMTQLCSAAPAPLLCTLAALFKMALSVNHVPMLLWSTQRSQWNPDTALHEGHVVSAQELTVLLEPVFTHNSRNLILFLQDTLSIDDFTYLSASYGNKNPFQNVQEILQSSPSSLVLPAVDCKATSYLLSFLQESGDWKLINITNLDVSQMEVNTSKPNLLVVQLKPLVSGLNEIFTLEAIAENDKIIGRLTMDLQEQGINFSVIYTAVRPSRISRRTGEVWKLRRQLMATEEEDSLSYPPLNVTTGNDTCILFYVRNFSLKANNSVFIDLTNMTFVTQNVDISSSECSDINTTLSLKYTKPVNGISSLEIRFLMTNKFYEGSARNWSTLDSVEIVQDGEKFAKFNVSVISAPAEYSFHCQLVGTSNLYPARLIPSNNEAKKWDVFISRLQIQGFNIENNQFSYASDCTGFFTPGIWMGLVTSTVLLWILAYGIYMIMQLTTNNRFDDPKGPALSVPQTE